MSKQSVSFSDLFDFTRSTVATYSDPLSGSLTEVAIDEPRFITEGLVLELAATNLLINSATPTTQTVTVTSGLPYTLTSYGSGAGYAFISNGGSGSAPIGNPITFTASGTTVEISVSGTIDGYQLEIGTESSNFIETGATSETRAVDSLSRTFGSEYNPDEGAFFIEFSSDYQSSLGVNLILSSGSSRAIVRSIEDGEYETYNGTITRDFPSAIPVSGVEKLAASFKSGEWILSRNGSSTNYATSSDTILDILDVHFFEVAEGVLSRFEYWPFTKTAEELDVLTLQAIVTVPRVNISATITDVRSDNINTYTEAGFSYDFSDNSRYFGTCTITVIESVDLFGILLSDNGIFRILLKHDATTGAIPQDFFESVVVEGVGTLLTSSATYSASLGTTGYDTSEWSWSTGINISTAGWTDAASRVVQFVGVIEDI